MLGCKGLMISVFQPSGKYFSCSYKGSVVFFIIGMGSTSSVPVAADSGAGVAIVAQTPSAGCPVQHSTPVPSVSECPAHQGGSVKLQASQCPISGGAGCDSAALDNSSDALDPSNMVNIL